MKVRATDFALTVILLAAGTVISQETPQQAPTGFKAYMLAHAQQREALGDWWFKSSLSYDTMPSGLLYHFEGTLSYMIMAGNTDGHIIASTPRGFIRVRRFTNDIRYESQKQHLEVRMSGDLLEQYSHSIHESVRFDVFKWLYVGGGTVWLRDNAQAIEYRTHVYGGIGAYPLSNKIASLVLFAAMGNEYQQYMQFAVDPTGTVLAEQTKTPGLLAQGVFNLNVTPQITFNESVQYTNFFDEERGFNVESSSTLSINLFSVVFLNVNYSMKYADKVLSILKNYDHTTTIGIMVSY